MKPLINLLIVEPSDIVREGLLSILSEGSQFNILSPLSSTSVLMDTVNKFHPDLLLINPTLLGDNACSTLLNLQQACPSMTIIALLYQYVGTKCLSSYKVVLDIRESRNQIAQILIDSCDIADDATTSENYDLSSRENEVLVLVAKGLSSKEIADKLNISIHTVNSHRKSITRKTGIKSVAGLAVYSMLHNLT